MFTCQAKRKSAPETVTLTLKDSPTALYTIAGSILSFAVAEEEAVSRFVRVAVRRNAEKTIISIFFSKFIFLSSQHGSSIL